MTDKYDFPNCMHVLAAAMHMQGIDPHDCTIEIPRDKWVGLQCALERQFRGFMIHDGRKQNVVDEFRYMGFRFKPRPQPTEVVMTGPHPSYRKP